MEYLVHNKEVKIDIGNDGVTISDKHGVIRTWTVSEWSDNPSTAVPVMAVSIAEAAENGGMYLRKILGCSNMFTGYDFWRTGDQIRLLKTVVNPSVKSSPIPAGTVGRVEALNFDSFSVTFAVPNQNYNVMLTFYKTEESYSFEIARRVQQEGDKFRLRRAWYNHNMRVLGDALTNSEGEPQEYGLYEDAVDDAFEALQRGNSELECVVITRMPKDEYVDHINYFDYDDWDGDLEDADFTNVEEDQEWQD